MLECIFESLICRASNRQFVFQRFSTCFIHYYYYHYYHHYYYYDMITIPIVIIIVMIITTIWLLFIFHHPHPEVDLIPCVIPPPIEMDYTGTRFP